MAYCEKFLRENEKKINLKETDDRNELEEELAVMCFFFCE